MALIFDLVRRRQAVLKLAQRASQVDVQSAGVQRDAVLAAVDVMVKAAKIEKPEVAIDPALLKNTDLLNE